MTDAERTIIRQAKLINALEEDIDERNKDLDNKRDTINALGREISRLQDRMKAKGVEF